MITSLALALLVHGAAPAIVARAPSPESTFDRAVAAYRKIRTARATFTQILTNPLTGDTTVSHGEVQQQPPGRFAVHFTDPAGDVIVADGKWLWVYLPSTNPDQVIKSPVAANSAGTPDFTAMFLEQPKSRYHISDAGTATVGGHRTHAITLVPTDDSLPFSKATIWVDDDDGIVRRFETTDANGVMRRVTVDSIRTNVRVDPEAFVFHPPRGARIFEQGGSS